MQGAFFPEANEQFKVEDKKIAQSTVRLAKIGHSTFFFFFFVVGFSFCEKCSQNNKPKTRVIQFFFRGHSIQFNFIQFLMPFIRSENYSWRWPSAGEHRSIIQTISRFLGSSERLQVRVWTIKCWTPFTIKITISVRRAVFKWLSKVIAWLRFLRSLIGLKDSCQFFNEWESKPRPIAPCTRDFFRVSSELQLIARNCDWFIALSAAVVIGRSNCFGFGFSTVIWKPL